MTLFATILDCTFNLQLFSIALLQEAVKKDLIDLRICREMNEDAAQAGIRPNAQR